MELLKWAGRSNTNKAEVESTQDFQDGRTGGAANYMLPPLHVCFFSTNTDRGHQKKKYPSLVNKGKCVIASWKGVGGQLFVSFYQFHPP